MLLALSPLLVLFALNRATAQSADLDFAPLRSGQIVVWVSAVPGSYSPGVKTSFARDFPNGELVERAIPTGNFAGQVSARRAQDLAPDIAFIDHYDQVEPLLLASDVWLVWERPRFATNGWWVIFKDTRHLARARAFVRWLAEAPGWQPRAESSSIPAETIKIVERASISALHAWFNGNQPGLEALLDADAARSRPGPLTRPPDRSPVPRSARDRVNHVRPILTFGNSRLAFVLLAVLASGDSFYGMRHMIFIFRNQGSRWRILYMNPDANEPSVTGEDGAAGSVSLLSAVASRIVGEGPEPPPPAVELVDPPIGAVLPRYPVRPDISWRSEAPATADFIIESQFGQPGADPDWSVSSLTFARVSRATQPFRQKAPFGAGSQPHRWRIWTLARSGAVSVSAWRTLIFSN
jgi:hypothetical protein